MIKTSPAAVFAEYRKGTEHKAGIGEKGIFEQAEINERFYIGDHWYGAKCGNDRPLVRRNIIKRIGDFKLSTVGSAPITVNYSAEGVAENTVAENERQQLFDKVTAGGDFSDKECADELEVSLMMRFLTDYGAVTMERLGFNSLANTALKNAYISGTGFLYTYWDEMCATGLYADAAKKQAIRGDIACEVLDVENVVMGEPNNDSVQNQPYIIISQRRDIEDVRREARRNGISAEDIELIRPDTAD